jgi:superfamily II DNA or RNA helicase/HKD family nuclease
MPDIKLITENLADELIPGIRKASSIYIMTSFVMESGVKLLAPHLKSAVERGAEVKVLGGDYLFISDPKGLRRLFELDDRIEVRLWRSNGSSFHPKAYLLDYDEGQGLLIVGSSNLSVSAYRLGVEWNLAMNAEANPFTFQSALEKFMNNFHHECTIPLNNETIASYEEDYDDYHQKYPELIRTITEIEESELMLPVKNKEASPDPSQKDQTSTEHGASGKIQPRPAQIAAMEALEQTIEYQYDKAMIVMATGLGKTYLAGFFALKFTRVLFIAHREEILHQAQISFKQIMPERTVGLYNGQSKDTVSDCIFASIDTLGMRKHREKFDPSAFDLIIVDEFHHAAAKSYRDVLNYFAPKFLLGITATPDRMDGKDVYAVCDGNVAFQLHFIEAIQRGWLSPFRYYGIYDDTDYGQISRIGSRYDGEELLAVQLREEMASKIYEAWAQYKQSRTLAFCSSIRQANYLSNYFRSRGARTVSLHSQTVEMSRGDALSQIRDGELDIIFTVDLFNEGVDIPSVDTLLFVRPTESLTVFTQQVGRGLRLHPGKEFCTIIDLMGNYRNADLKLSLFEANIDGFVGGKEVVTSISSVGGVLNLDLSVINLLKELLRGKQPRKERLRYAYMELKQELGRRPTYLELHLHGKATREEYKREFGSYVGFLHWAEELDAKETEVFLRYERWLKEVESTGMSKSYKMIVLLYMLDRGVESWLEPITSVEAAAYFHHYLMEKEYRKMIDFFDSGARMLWEYDEKKVGKLIATMPMNKWAGSSSGLVSYVDDVFGIQMNVGQDQQGVEQKKLLHQWTSEICLFRLHYHFERRSFVE